MDLGGIADYWILNLVDRVVEVYRDPVPYAAAPHGSRYGSLAVVRPPGSITLLAIPTARVTVSLLRS